MIVELKFLERAVLLNLLPKEGNYKTLKLLRVFKEALSMTEEENKALDVKEDNGVIRWNREADKPKTFEVGDTMRGVIWNLLDGMEKEGKLNENHLTLYEKFQPMDAEV